MTDVIRQTGSLEGRRPAKEGGSRIAARHSSQPEVLHGAESSGVQLTQLTSGQPVFTLGNTWNVAAGSQTIILSEKTAQRKHETETKTSQQLHKSKTGAENRKPQDVTDSILQLRLSFCPSRDRLSRSSQFLTVCDRQRLPR